jgi:hypothetical protein
MFPAAVSLDPGKRYSCCANISNLRQHLWHIIGSKSAKEQSQSRRIRNGHNLLEWKDFLQLQTVENRQKQEYSIIIENSRIWIMFLWPFVLFNSADSFSKQDFESIDPTLFFLATTFSGFPLYFPRYTDPNVPQPNFFSFSKSCHSNFGNSGSFFAFPFRLVGILKLAAILFHFGQILARNCGPSPRFTNRLQSAFY